MLAMVGVIVQSFVHLPDPTKSAFSNPRPIGALCQVKWEVLAGRDPCDDSVCGRGIMQHTRGGISSEFRTRQLESCWP